MASLKISLSFFKNVGKRDLRLSICSIFGRAVQHNKWTYVCVLLLIPMAASTAAVITCLICSSRRFFKLWPDRAFHNFRERIDIFLVDRRFCYCYNGETFCRVATACMTEACVAWLLIICFEEICSTQRPHPGSNLKCDRLKKRNIQAL